MNLTDDTILEAVRNELVRARRKFPDWQQDIIHGAAIVAEESGELIRAALLHKYEKGGAEAILVEAVQTAAMCFRLLTETKGLKEALK